MPQLTVPARTRSARESSVLFAGVQGAVSAGVVCGGWLAASVVLISRPAGAQEALKDSLAGEASVEKRSLEQQAQLYTLKAGDLRLMINPSLSLNWNDNVNLSNNSPEGDFILMPLVLVDASYPVTQHNLLQLNLTFGYDKYLKHDELSRWHLESGSQLSFDIYVKDWWINLHDRFQFVQDAAQHAAVAGTGNFAFFQNTAGLSGTWDLRDVTLTLGYDHQSYISSSSQFEYLNHASEMTFARAGLQLHPKMTAGIEGTATFTAYDQKVLNDNANYSGGVYGDWRPGSYSRIQPHFGYTFYDFQQTSQSVRAENQSSWYADLTVTHEPTRAVSYSLSAGHELRLGIESDAVEDWYLRANMNWSLIKDVTLQTTFFWENGRQSGGRLGGGLEEKYDWHGGSLSIGYSPLKKVGLSLNYRLTLRSSNIPSREYTQNMVGLQVTYIP